MVLKKSRQTKGTEIEDIKNVESAFKDGIGYDSAKLIESARGAVGNRKSYSLDVNDPPFIRIDHVQLTMPAGMEDQARAFYCGLLGMTEIEKPAELKKRGGCWFQSGAVQIHLGVEAEFRPAKKAHPALRCFDYHALTERLRFAGIDTHDDLTIPGVLRCHISDPFGNRIELICA